MSELGVGSREIGQQFVHPGLVRGGDLGELVRATPREADADGSGDPSDGGLPRDETPRPRADR